MTADLPAAGEPADVDLDGETVRAAAGELPESASARVVLFTETEAGGFFDSSPRIVAAVLAFLGVALAFIYFLFRTLQGQIGSMLDAAQRIGGGDFSGRVPVVGRDEMAGLASEFNLMSDRLEAQIEQLRSQRTELDRSVTRLARRGRLRARPRGAADDRRRDRARRLLGGVRHRSRSSTGP